MRLERASGRSDLGLTKLAVGFSVGLLMVVYSIITYLQYAYMSVNPEINNISTSFSGILFYAIIFLAGSFLIFISFALVMEDLDDK